RPCNIRKLFTAERPHPENADAFSDLPNGEVGEIAANPFQGNEIQARFCLFPTSPIVFNTRANGVKTMFGSATRHRLGAVLGGIALALVITDLALKSAGLSLLEPTGFHPDLQPGTLRTLGALLFASRILVGRGLARL